MTQVVGCDSGQQPQLHVNNYPCTAPCSMPEPLPLLPFPAPPSLFSRLQDSQSQQALLITQLQQQASELTSAAAAMPLRVQRMDSLLAAMEAGELKLRVRVLEAERAARRAGVMQVSQGWKGGEGGSRGSRGVAVGPWARCGSSGVHCV
jgi:hypothetical protein